MVIKMKILLFGCVLQQCQHSENYIENYYQMEQIHLELVYHQELIHLMLLTVKFI
jgi:hypothetical protein